MAKLEWDEIGKRFYETGVDRGVLYLPNETGAYVKGVAWNGLVTVSESPSGAESNAQYADNIKYLDLISKEEFGASIEAFTYPDEFAECDGTAELTGAAGVFLSQQSRKSFGFSYRTLIGNDTKGTDLGYKLHLVYGCKATPSEKSRTTVNDSPEAVTFSWEVTTTPVNVGIENHKPTSHIVIDSTKIAPEKLAKIEEALYGGESKEPNLPLPKDILALVSGE